MIAVINCQTVASDVLSYLRPILGLSKPHDGTRWDMLQDGFAVRLSVDHRPDNAGERRRGHLRAPAGYGEVQVRHGERVKLKHQLWGPIQPLYQYMAIDF